MLAKLLKAIVVLCVLLLLTVTSMALSVKYAPQTSLSMLTRLTPYEISASAVEVGLWPLSIKMAEVTLDTMGDRRLADLEKLELLVDWRGLILGRQQCVVWQLKRGRDRPFLGWPLR